MIILYPMYILISLRINRQNIISHHFGNGFLSSMILMLLKNSWRDIVRSARLSYQKPGERLNLNYFTEPTTLSAPNLQIRHNHSVLGAHSNGAHYFIASGNAHLFLHSGTRYLDIPLRTPYYVSLAVKCQLPSSNLQICWPS